MFHACDRADVIVAIRQVLEDLSLPEGSRYWVTQVAAAFADASLRNGLALSAGSQHQDIREAAQLCLELLNGHVTR